MTKKKDLNKAIKYQCQHLTEDIRKYLLNLFQKPEDFFGGTLDTRKTDPVK